MGALIATHHSSRRMNKTLLLVVSAIALATAVQPDVSVPADAFTEAAQLVQSMQKQGQDDSACLQLAKDFEYKVKTNVAALQEAQGNLDTGADCDNAGQSGVTAAKKVRDDAKDAVDNAQKAFNTANTAAVTIGTFAFNTLKPGNCGMFFSTSAYTSAESTQKASKQALDQATGALATAEKGVTAAISQAKKDVQDCKCKVYNNHKDTLTRDQSVQVPPGMVCAPLDDVLRLHEEGGLPLQQCQVQLAWPHLLQPVRVDSVHFRRQVALAVRLQGQYHGQQAIPARRELPRVRREHWLQHQRLRRLGVHEGGYPVRCQEDSCQQDKQAEWALVGCANTTPHSTKMMREVS